MNLLRKPVYSKRNEIIELLFYLQNENPDKNVRGVPQREHRKVREQILQSFEFSVSKETGRNCEST